MSEGLELVNVTDVEAIADIIAGVHRRLSSAAWRAKVACEQITKADADPLTEIAVAEVALDEARRHAEALRHYLKLGSR